MSDQIFWFLSRSSGLMSWLAAAGSMLVGTMIPSRLLGRRPTIPWLTDLHRMLAAMASIFLLIHMGTLWFDHFVAFRFDDLLIPFVATVPGLSRFSLAVGVIAAWLIAAIQLTSIFKHRFYDSTWRTIHLSSYGALVLGTLHAVLAGSDIDNPIIAALGTSVLTAVAMATLVRIRRMRQQRAASASPTPASSPTATQASTQSPAPDPPTAGRNLRVPPPQRPGSTVSATPAGTRPPIDRPGRGPLAGD